MGDDQVQDKPKAGIHEPGTSAGNELAKDKSREPGRKAEGKDGADRPIGGRDSRDSTGINPGNEKAGSGKDMPPA